MALKRSPLRLTTVIGASVTALTLLVTLIVAVSLHLTASYRLTNEFQSKVVAESQKLSFALTHQLGMVKSRLRELSLDNSVRVTLMLGVKRQLAERLEVFHDTPQGTHYFVRSPTFAGTIITDHQTKLDNFLANEIARGTLAKGTLFALPAGQFAIAYSAPIMRRNQELGTAFAIHRLGSGALSKEIFKFSNDLRLIVHDGDKNWDLMSGAELSIEGQQVGETSSDILSAAIIGNAKGLIGRVNGFPQLRLFVSSESIETAKNESLLIVAVTATIGIVLGILLATVLVGWIKKPLEAAVAAAQDAAHGQDWNAGPVLQTGQIQEFNQFFQSLIEIVGNLRRAKDEREKGEQQFKDFAKSAADRFWETDTKFRYVFVTPPSGRLTRTTNSLLGKTPWEIEGSESERWDDLKEIFSKHEPVRDFHYVWTGSNGIPRYLHLTAVPYYDDHGEYAGHRGTTVDETDNVEARLKFESIQNQFNDAMESLSAGFILWDKNGQFVMCNSFFRRYQGESGKYLEPGIHFEDYIRKVAESGRIAIDKSEIENWVQTQLEMRKIGISDHEDVQLDGRIFRVTMQRLADGSVIAFHFDMTKTKHAESQLLESEQRFKDFAEATADRFWALDKDFKFTYYSERKGIQGRPIGEILGRKPWEVEPGDADSDRWPDFKQVLEKHQSFRDFSVKITIDNVQRYIRFSGVPIFDAEHNFSGYRGTTVDETSEVLAKQEADTAHQQFLAAMDNISEGFAMWDADEKLVASNRLYRLIHSDLGDILTPGLKLADFMKIRADSGRPANAKGRESEWVEEQLNRMRTGAENYDFEYSGRWYSSRYHPLPDGSIITLQADVTKNRVHERQIRDAAEKSEAATRAKSEFLANMSHELRTPLNAIIGFSETLSEKVFGPLNNEKQEEYVEDIHKSGHHLLSIINDILDLSAVESGKFELHETDIDLDTVTAYSRQIMQSQASKKGVHLSIKLIGTLPKIRADELRIKQVLINILSNAVKFTPEGGKVTLSCRCEDDGSVVLLVTDTGIGMDEKGLAKALEKFGQINNEMMLDKQGTGLGLPLTKGLVEAHGGKLEISSEPNKGTTVAIHIPKDRVLNLDQDRMQI